MEKIARSLVSKVKIVADLDGTLTESKMSIGKEMRQLIFELLKIKKFAVIGGGLYGLFQNQLTNTLPKGANL